MRARGCGASVRLRAVAVRAVHAHGAVAQFLRQDGAELERRTQLHVHGARQVFLAEQRQRDAVDGLFPETLEKQNETQTLVRIIYNIFVHKRDMIITYRINDYYNSAVASCARAHTRER